MLDVFAEHLDLRIVVLELRGYGLFFAMVLFSRAIVLRRPVRANGVFGFDAP
jgi:hypothetical protein